MARIPRTLNSPPGAQNTNEILRGIRDALQGIHQELKKANSLAIPPSHPGAPGIPGQYEEDDDYEYVYHDGKWMRRKKDGIASE